MIHKEAGAQIQVTVHCALRASVLPPPVPCIVHVDLIKAS